MLPLCLYLIFYFGPQNGNEAALYLRAKRKPTDGEWYADVGVGINTITKVVKNMCSKAGLEGFYSNHSLRATAATRMYAADLPEQLTSEKTGQRSEAIRSYRRTSSIQNVSASDAVQGVKRKVSETNVCNPVAVRDSSSGPASSSVKIQVGDVVEINI